MGKIKLARIVFIATFLLFLFNFITFFFNPGLVLKTTGFYSLYYLVPILFFIALTDYILNKESEKKYFLYTIILSLLFLVLLVALNYWAGISFIRSFP